MNPTLRASNYLLRGRLSTGILFLLSLLAAIPSTTALAQSYREWRDTTLPEMPPIRRTSGQNGFPIGIFIYSADFNRPHWELVHYMNRTGIDHIIHGVRKDYDGYRNKSNWTRYLELLDSLEANGKRIIPLIDYGGFNNIPTYAGEAEHAREIIFYPFDSSQLRRWEERENLFTFFDYDSTVANPNHIDPRDSSAFRESIYNPGSMANQTIASGVAFDYKAGQTVRWNQVYQSGSWNAVANPINSTAIFEQINYDDTWHNHRSPHYIVVTGHLFENGTASDNDTLLRINVWFEVDRGKKYLDSLNAVQTADTNLRFLYKSVGVTKEELVAIGSPQNWNEYREAIKRVSFEREGMGGPTRTDTTARRFDIEVIYLGGEKLALRSVALRDSIANLLMDQGSNGANYRQKMKREIDTLVRYSYNGQIRPGVYNLNIADEPKFTQFAGFREAKRLIEQNFHLGTDTMTTLNGWAIPHLPWLGDADVLTIGNYMGNHYYDNGDVFGFDTDPDSMLYRDIPSVRQHNGGRFSIPIFFDFDSLGSPGYVGTLPGRIDTMELLWQHTRMGAATPNQPNVSSWVNDLWRVRSMHMAASKAREMGTPFQNYVGPNSWFELRYDSATGFTDTIGDHRPERAELRALTRLALAYGAHAVTFYKFPTWPWMKRRTDSLGAHPYGDWEPGLCGFNVADTAHNIIDWTLRDPNLGYATVVNNEVIFDSLGVVPGIYFGFRNLHREMIESVAWLRQIGPFMTRLRWRDAYSVHFQADVPGTDYESLKNVQYRTIPSDEIVTEVRSWHPISGKVDSAYATYVELGLFDTMIDTTGGVRNRMKDTNYVMVVNRRVFETGNYDTTDIGYSAAVKAMLDTLSETRTVSLKFNLPNPDSTQYSFIRVREVFPDTLHLPVIGARNILDTIISGVDSCVHITLGAGRAALLEMTYMPPDESIIDGRLAFNNQRKLIYGLDDKWHCVYLRNDSILYRRSLKAGPDPGSILWEPVETFVSTDTVIGRIKNWFPSMTMRVLGGDTIVTVVWSCHTTNSTAALLGLRDVVVRDLNLTQGTRSNIWWIDYHWGRDSMQWGDVVVNAEHGGDIIAWGDSLIGIVARVRKLGPFGVPPTLSAPDSVSWNYHACGYVGRWPAVPTFAHIASADSNCGIAYNQPQCGGGSHIYYQRLQHVVLGGGVPGLANLNILTVSPTTGDLGRPSMDQTQDVWHRVQEGITWVEDVTWTPPSKIWFRSMFTETRNRANWDSIEMTQGWGMAWTTGGKWGVNGDSWPSAGSLNEVYAPADTAKEAHFAVAFVRNPEDPTPELRQGVIKYSETSFKTGWPLSYTYWGDYPQGSSSPIQQQYRHGVLYETTIPSSGPVLRTTRQFFGAKSRPTGYIAEGREVVIRLSDSMPTGFVGFLNDVWLSDEDNGRPLELARRNFVERTDALSDAEELLRTEMFQTHDSVEIGLELYGRFFGDDGTGGNATLRLIAELVDSASGQVIYGMDSIEITTNDDSVHVISSYLYDLLSSTYYIRVRIDTSDAPIVSIRTWESRYAVVECASYVGNELAAKRARRLDGEAGSGTRVNAQPNPFGRETEVRFSIARHDYITLTIYDALGRMIERLVDGELFDAGRYAVEFDGTDLPSGAYLIELRTSSERVVEKVSLHR